MFPSGLGFKPAAVTSWSKSLTFVPTKNIDKKLKAPYNIDDVKHFLFQIQSIEFFNPQSTNMMVLGTPTLTPVNSI